MEVGAKVVMIDQQEHLAIQLLLVALQGVAAEAFQVEAQVQIAVDQGVVNN
jgi:hypothetical protein